MNPLDRFQIDNYKKLLKDIDKLDRVEVLQDLEARVIKEIVLLVEDGSEMAKYLIGKLEKAITRKLSYSPRNKILTTALEESLRGAFAAARNSL
jgi:hypothetical protein